jgi:F-type H+-transporting ATPase subunit b
MELLKLLSRNEVIAQIVGFLVLLAILKVFVWKKLLGLLDKRKEKIASDLKIIEEAKLDVQKISLEYQAKLSDIDKEANKKIQEAIDETKVILAEARKTAHLQAQEIIDNAKNNIKSELSRAKDELKNEIIDLTIKATENVINERLTEEGDRKLISDFLDGVDKL